MEMENPQEQNKKQYDWLKGYQFVKGQSGNPGGRPKGAKSLKTFAREFLEALPPEEKIEFMKTLPSELIWKMSEGMPRQDTSMEVDAKLQIDISEKLVGKYKLNDPSSSTEQNS